VLQYVPVGQVSPLPQSRSQTPARMHAVFDCVMRQLSTVVYVQVVVHNPVAFGSSASE